MYDMSAQGVDDPTGKMTTDTTDCAFTVAYDRTAIVHV